MGSIVIPQEYGYVLTTFATGALLLFSMGAQVSKYRKAAGVPYPYAYAEKAEAEKDPKKHLFNCAQRVHQNTLEVFPVYSTFLLIAGIKYPVYASTCGAIFWVGRYFYSSGYLSGDPAKRTRGAIGYIGFFGLLGMTGSTLYSILK